MDQNTSKSKQKARARDIITKVYCFGKKLILYK